MMKNGLKDYAPLLIPNFPIRIVIVVKLMTVDIVNFPKTWKERYYESFGKGRT